jgi:hypothetical protein
MIERSITGAELMKTLPEILEDIAQRGTVFLVHMGNAADAGGIISGLVSATNEIVFAVGAPHLLGEVFGLIDAEYGWPHPIALSEVKTVSDLLPGYRRHPIIYCGGECLAISISVGEYELLKQR